MRLLFVITVFSFLILSGHGAEAQTNPITITQISDLNFGSAFLGDPGKNVNRGRVDNAENASFLITGDRGSTFNVTLPNRIWITHATSGDRIRVRRFRSRPNSSGRIRNNGERLLLVGARRNAIPQNISTGFYSGSFTVTVIY